MPEPSSETVQSLLKRASLKLKQAGIESARLEAELILAELLGVSRAELYLVWEKSLSPPLIRRAEQMLEKRAQRMPLAYLLKKAWFRELELEIDDSVMVPRPETELLVEKAIEVILSYPKVRKILDLGTGSGAIILSLAYELKELKDQLEFYASDISERALQLAKRNAQKHGLEKRIRFFLGDLFQPFSGERFDLIICNPPYIPSDAFNSLEPEVAEYEPRIALNGGEKGLEVIEQILTRAHQYLNPEGFLIMEIGFGQLKEFNSFSFPFLRIEKIERDYTGRERIVILRS